jgi:Protein of unknown function (DUF2934)
MHSMAENTDKALAVQRLAHAYWEARGRPCGSPEKDWFRAEQKIERRNARAELLTYYSVKMASGLGILAKALLLLLAVVLVTYVGVWMAVWIVGAHSLAIHGMLDILPRLIAPLGKVLVLALFMMVTTAFVRVIGVWIIRGYSTTIHGDLDLLPRLTAPLGKTLVLALLIMLGTALVRLMGSWMAGGDTITVASFTDTRVEASREKGAGLGHTITDTLTSKIHRINQLHIAKNPWGSGEEAPPLEMTGPQAYERVGTVSFAGIELPVGEVILALRALWPSWYTRYVITGSLQNCLGVKATCARLIVRLEEDGRTRKHWSYELLLNNEDALDGQVQALAYEIVWSTVSGIEANSLESFRGLMEGIALFRQYKDTGDSEVFNKAESHLLNVTEKDKKYARAHFYLGNLYNWAAYFSDPESEEEKNYREKAMSCYTKAEHGYTAKPYEAESFMNFGMGLVYHRSYSKIKEHYRGPFIEKLPELNALLIKANKYYTRVTDQDEDFYFARTGRALIYKEKEYLSSRGFNGIDKPELYIHCAMKELRHAKYLAEERKDNLRWFDATLHDLERKLRHGKGGWPWLQAAYSWVAALQSQCLESDGMPSDYFLYSPLVQHYHQ